MYDFGPDGEFQDLLGATSSSLDISLYVLAQLRRDTPLRPASLCLQSRATEDGPRRRLAAK